MKISNTHNDQTYINEVLAIALNHSMNNKGDSYRPQWHFSPQFGLLNDPNGLAYFNGEYHLFYQWNPKACSHGAKAWGHATSPDLINWTHQPLALAPTEDYETHGCYSGSGLVVDNKLELFYTGNVKFDNGGRTAYQCRATLEKGTQLKKQGIMLALPEGYSGHVRDPKVWQHNGSFFMVLGAEDLNYRGKVLVYRTEDINNWTLVGEIFGYGICGNQSDDFMHECPDLFPLEDRHVLISCPKNWINGDGKKVETFDVTYHIGSLDYEKMVFDHQPTRVLMDYGFDFYAPQTFLDPQNRRLVFGWMGKPDEFESYQPTIQHNWIHQMTCARELTLSGNQLIQTPVKEIEALRCDQQSLTETSVRLSGLSAELLLQDLDSNTLMIEVAKDLRIEVAERGLKTWRNNLKTGKWEYREWLGRVNSLRLLRDHSCVEAFINEGEAVATSRFFGLTVVGSESDVGFLIESSRPVSVTHWQLRV